MARMTSRRTREMVEAVKAAENQALQAWSDSRSQQRGDLTKWRAAARAAARADLRAQWAREDAEQPMPPPPHMSRIDPDDSPKIDKLKAAREVYIAELRKLNASARKKELQRLLIVVWR